MSKEQIKFEVNDKEYFIKPAGSKVLTEAQRVYNKAFRDAIEGGAILKKSLEEHMIEQGLWDEEKQKEYIDLIKESADLEYKIKSGKLKKASELRDTALQLKKTRNKLTALLVDRNSMDSNTAEGQADNTRFNYLLTQCVYDYLTQKPVFSSLQDYEDKMEEEYAIECAMKFANYLYGLKEDFESSLLENRLLKKLNLLDEKGRLVNREGQFVNADGHLIDENGNRIDEDGNRVDINDNPLIDDDVIDSLEFEDDLVEKPKKPRSRKKSE